MVTEVGAARCKWVRARRRVGLRGDSSGPLGHWAHRSSRRRSSSGHSTARKRGQKTEGDQNDADFPLPRVADGENIFR